MDVRGSLRYVWPGGGLEEALQLRGDDERVYDVAVVGAGVVGCALACELARHRLRVLLLERAFDVGEGSSKGNSAIVHTGFDATPGSLEADLVTRAAGIWPQRAQKLKIPFQQTGALLAALDEEQLGLLEGIRAKALENGVDDLQLLSRQQALQAEPALAPGVRGGLLVPRESITDPFAVSIACAELALVNGAQIVLGAEVTGLERDGAEKLLRLRSGQRFRTRLLVNAAGLGGRTLADLHGGAPFDINPRRGQFLVFDQSSRSLVRRILLPVPTPRSKGVLCIPTIFGNLLAGPTAEDLPLGSPEATRTTREGLQRMLDQAQRLCPALARQPVIAAYAGARCHSPQGSYQLRYDDGWPGVLTVAGIRSTGLTSCFALAEHIARGLQRHSGLRLEPDPQALDERPEQAWPGWHRRPWERGAEGLEVICGCEGITRGEILRALRAPLAPRTLDGLKRRTRVLTGRCQGFGCAVAVARIAARRWGIPLERVTLRGPGSELFATQRRTHGP